MATLGYDDTQYIRNEFSGILNKSWMLSTHFIQSHFEPC